MQGGSLVCSDREVILFFIFFVSWQYVSQSQGPYVVL